MNYISKTKTFNCEYCGKEHPWKYSSRNKFCNNNCQRLHEWETKTKPKIEQGKGKTGTSAVLRFLIERDGYKCSCCGITEWNGEFITLDIDHIDGDNTNNFPDNLRLMCPNCHRQTPTWGNNRKDVVPVIYKKAISLLESHGEMVSHHRDMVE